MSDFSDPPYWDANVFLSYIEATPGRVEAIESILDALKSRGIGVVTSAVSVTEVAFTGAERSGRSLDPVAGRLIEAIWADPLLHLVEVTLPIAVAARQIVRGSIVAGPRLKPLDAIHLATARHVASSVMHTYDVDLRRHSGRYGFSIEPPIASAAGRFW